MNRTFLTQFKHEMKEIALAENQIMLGIDN